MVHFSSLAVAISVLTNCLYAVTADFSLSQEQFETMIAGIPDNEVRDEAELFYAEKKYVELGDTMVDYLDEYLNEKYKDLETEVVNNKKDVIIGAVFNFIDEKEMEKVELQLKMEEEKKQKEEELMEQELEMQVKKDEMENELETLVMEEETKEEELQDSSDHLLELIGTLPSEEVKEESVNLLKGKRLIQLEDTILRYTDEYLPTLNYSEQDKFKDHIREIQDEIRSVMLNARLPTPASEDSEEKSELIDSDMKEALFEISEEEKKIAELLSQMGV